MFKVNVSHMIFTLPSQIAQKLVSVSFCLKMRHWAPFCHRNNEGSAACSVLAVHPIKPEENPSFHARMRTTVTLSLERQRNWTLQAPTILVEEEINYRFNMRKKESGSAIILAILLLTFYLKKIKYLWYSHKPFDLYFFKDL